MADHLSNGTDKDNAIVAQLQHELTKAKRRHLTIYTLCKNSVETTEKLHHRCIQTDRKLKIMIGMFLFSVLINGILLGIVFHLTGKNPDTSPTIYIPERMMPHIHEIT